MYILARKNYLAINLMKMCRVFDKEYKIAPPTWLLPTDWNAFVDQFTKKRAKTFIVKPEASCQGRGIFLTRNYKNLDRNEHYVVQRYLHKPYLIDDLKFDLRIYVLLVGVNPLRAYIYKEGMARFATEPYCSPGGSNLKNLYMHLTNYAINKNHEDYEEGDDSNSGHKRYMSYIFEYLEETEGPNKIWENIKDIINKALITVQPSLAHAYRT
jgi:tubulin polyglutamylase TTLL6/13